jgi:uncharacterized membrane protein (UPF0182 family)
VDGYTTSATFPLATQARLAEGQAVRYVRNSVKASVDGLTGATTLYALRDDEPMLQAYRAAFPGLIHPLSDLPPVLRPHLRFPGALARLQASILESYHVGESGTFFSGEDAWQVPTEGGGPGSATGSRPVELVGMIPGETESDYWLSVPFIARERQNMTAMLFIRHGAEHYGETVLVEFPRESFVPGPPQVRTLVEQDPGISNQLTLWRDGGSSADLGRIRVIPLDTTVLYVQPLFLSASVGSIPQLTQIIASDGQSVFMAETLAAAVDGLGGRAPRTPGRNVSAPSVEGDVPEDALQLLEEARRRLQNGDFAGFGEALDRLERLLREALPSRSTG